MKYILKQDGFEDYSVVDENGTIVSQHITFAGHGEVLINQLDWGLIKPEDICVAKPDGKRKKHAIVLSNKNFCRLPSGDNIHIIIESDLFELKNKLKKELIKCRQDELIPYIFNYVNDDTVFNNFIKELCLDLKIKYWSSEDICLISDHLELFSLLHYQ